MTERTNDTMLVEQLRTHGLRDGSMKERLLAQAADEIERLQNRLNEITRVKP